MDFRNNVTVVNKPEAYGWVEINKENEAKKVSVKVPISLNPTNDHAVVGTFGLKRVNTLWMLQKR